MTTAERLEQLRDLPLVTAADRERYKQWEQEARAELAEAEPGHARDERARNALLGTRDGFPLAEWHQWWRSLPDYDGPPMRAPSGVRWVVDAVTGLLASEPMCVAAVPVVAAIPLALRFGEIEEYSMPSIRDLRERFVVGKYEAIFGAPSAGGRGWCPKLAEAV